MTETKDKFQGLPLGRPGRADRRRPDVSTYFLTTFGRATRETVCSCEVKIEPTLSQALHLLNGDTINGKIAEGKVVAKMLAEKGEPRDVADALWRACLSRRPTETESQQIAAKLAECARQGEGSRRSVLGFAQLKEFLFNH